MLEPLSAQQTARYRAYDWTTGALGDYKELGPHGTILVEGVYSARPELRRYYDACLLVETPQRAREERQERRADASEAWLGRWDAAERYYLDRYSYADLVVHTE